jgi:ketosteroid isomerase-like protein
MRSLTIDEIRTRIDAFFAAYSAHDPEAILALCTEDVVWEDPLMGPPLKGWEEAAELLVNQLTAFPDLHFPSEEIELYRAVDGKTAAAGWHLAGTMTGRLDPPGYEPTGAAVDVTGMSRFEFAAGGLIADHSMVYDTLTLARRLHLAPGEHSLSFRTMVGLQQAEQFGRRLMHNLRR